jgi:hypothetical protein
LDEAARDGKPYRDVVEDANELFREEGGVGDIPTDKIKV